MEVKEIPLGKVVYPDSPDVFSKALVVEGVWYPDGSFLADGHVYDWHKDPKRVKAIFFVYRSQEE